ncbi:conserved hypothetical protein [Gammaproteobacteria bacterium]
MKTLRWKGRYLTGSPEIDQKNREFVDCLNGFVHAIKQREHCQEIEKLLEDSLEKLENQLVEDPAAADLVAEMKTSLISSFPMPTRDTPACRKCDVCDLAEQRIAQHIKPSALCLGVTEKTSILKT